MSKEKSAVEILDESKKLLAQLTEKRTRAQVRLETEKQALEAAKAEARQLFGTDDIEELRRMYATRQADNDRKVAEFVMGLSEAETKLADVERQIAV